MAAQIHNFQILSHLFDFSFQSLCGALGDASRSTWYSAEHSLGISALEHGCAVFCPWKRGVQSFVRGRTPKITIMSEELLPKEIFYRSLKLRSGGAYCNTC